MPRGRRSLALAGVFVASRVFWWAAGVRFDSRLVDGAIQLADPRALHHDLWRSLWYLHTQPPLFNLLVGVGLNLFGSHVGGFLQAVYLTAGLLLGLGVLRLMEVLGVKPRPAFVVAAVFVVNPVTVLYENWFFYPYLEATLLVAAALLVHRYLGADRASTRYRVAACGLAATLAALPLLRSLWHLVWLLAVLAIIAVGGRIGWRRTAALGAVPVLLVAGWYAKNLVLFGSFTGSSLQGPNLARVTVYALPDAVRQELSARGDLSALARYPSFVPDYSVIAPVAPKPPRSPHTGARVLDDPEKSTHQPNFNYRGYLPVYDQQLDDALWVLREHPDTWLKGQARAWVISSYSPTDNLRLYPNAHRISWAVTGFNRLTGQFTSPPSELGERTGKLSDGGTAWGTVLAWALAMLGLPVVWWRWRRTDHEARAGRTTLAFVWFSLVYGTVVGNAFELGENNRFRFATDPLLLVGVVVVVAEVVRWARARHAAPAMLEPALQDS
jgi:hypothetical protein